MLFNLYARFWTPKEKRVSISAPLISLLLRDLMPEEVADHTPHVQHRFYRTGLISVAGIRTGEPVHRLLQKNFPLVSAPDTIVEFFICVF